MGRILTIGLAGYGRSGRNIHTNYLKNDPRFKIVAVADALENRRGEAAAELGARCYTDYREMLAKDSFDLFINATPSIYHVEATAAGLKKCDTISEKPAASTLAEFDMLTRLAQENGHRLLPFQNSRFYPYYRKAKAVADSGVLGKIIAIRLNWSNFARRWDWQTRQDMLAGNLFNTGPHPVDQALMFFGEGTPRVFCRMASEHFDFGGDADNFCALTLYGDGSPTVEVQISSFAAYPQGDQINIQGSCGGLAGGPAGLRWKYFDPAKAPKHTLWQPWSLDRQYCAETLNFQECSWGFSNPNCIESGMEGLSESFYNQLYEVLVHGGKQEITLEQVRRQVYVMEEAHRQNPLPKKELI